MRYTRFRFVPNWFKSVLIGIFIGLITTLLVYLLLLLIPKQKSPFINDDKFDPIMATCLVDNARGTGTGVLLNTGYIITAGHVVDINRDGTIDKKERNLKVIFYDDLGAIATIHSARIVYSWGAKKAKNDFAILEVPENIKSKVKLIKDYVKVGEELFTIGCSKGRIPHIAYGYKSTDHYYPLKRASLDTYFGSSGGGIYIDEHKMVGIVKGVGFDRRSTPIRAHLVIGKGKKVQLHFIQGRVNYFDVVPGWTEYTTANEIINHLESKNLLQLVEVQDKEFNIVYPKYILITLLQILAVLFCVGYFRKIIFTP